MTIRPLSGISRPAIIRSKVVLPQPDGPSSANSAPRLIFSETSSTAATAPKCLCTPATLSSGMPGSFPRFEPRPGSGARPLVFRRRRQVDEKPLADIRGRVDRGVVADRGLDQQGAGQIRVRV